MTLALSLLAGVAAAFALAHGAWWTLLSLVALQRPGRGRQESTVRDLVVVVPAHNEERMVGATVTSLRAALDGDTVEFVVVADNCTDGTAEAARAAGASVLVRDDPEHRGKSYALDHALEWLAARGHPPRAVAFVDADTAVSANFLQAVFGAITGGADAVQVHYAAAGSGSLGGLRRLAFLLVHYARPLGASRLGLGTTLKGNGMAFSWATVAGGVGGSGITEDAAWTLDLARRGTSVTYVPEATVWGHMASTYGAAAVQDRRWEGGRFALAWPALRVAVGRAVRGDFRSTATALEVASLPLSLVVLLATGSAVAALAGLLPVWFGLSALVSVVAYPPIGWAAARVPLADLKPLASVPRFLLHKFAVYAHLAARRGPAEWQRTERTP